MTVAAGTAGAAVGPAARAPAAAQLGDTGATAAQEIVVLLGKVQGRNCC